MSKAGDVLFGNFVAGCNVENLCHTMSMAIVRLSKKNFHPAHLQQRFTSLLPCIVRKWQAEQLIWDVGHRTLLRLWASNTGHFPTLLDIEGMGGWWYWNLGNSISHYPALTPTTLSLAWWGWDWAMTPGWLRDVVCHQIWPFWWKLRFWK